jgi:SAM-dependent methyltransferase
MSFDDVPTRLIFLTWIDDGFFPLSSGDYLIIIHCACCNPACSPGREQGDKIPARYPALMKLYVLQAFEGCLINWCPEKGMQQVEICPSCHGKSIVRFESASHAGKLLQYWICGSCGLVFQSPRPGETDLQAFYREGYRSLCQETEQPIKKDLVMQSTRAALAVQMIRKDIPLITRHLDIGSSSGAFLLAVREVYGNKMVGVEPGEGYRSFSQQQGIATYASLDELLVDEGGGFDFVSMLHVLEHLSEPVQVLTDLKRSHLKPGGYLLIEVPNLYEHESFEFAHLYAFSPSSLRGLVERAGFEVQWTKTHGSFRSPVLKLYLTLLARSAAGSPRTQSRLVFPWLIRARRKLGSLKRRIFTRLLPDWTWQSPSELWEDQPVKD